MRDHDENDEPGFVSVCISDSKYNPKRSPDLIPNAWVSKAKTVEYFPKQLNTV